MKEHRKLLKRSILIGGMIGLIVGLLPLLPMFDLILDIEFLEILLIPLVPISLFTRSLLAILIISPILYAALGIIIGFMIAKKRLNEK